MAKLMVNELPWEQGLYFTEFKNWLRSYIFDASMF
jgi:hypothetical protein